MKHPRPRFGRLLTALLAACYGILSVAATGPHAHDLQAAAAGWAPSYAQGASIDQPAPRKPAGQGERLDHCRLCAFGRSTARPAFTAAMNEAERPRLALRSIREQTFTENPPAFTALLRAPPRV